MGNSTSAYTEADCEVTLKGQSGRICGVQYDGRCRRYANIPYAKAPSGALRWRKPQPLDSGFSYSSTDGDAFDGTKLGQVCPQPTYSQSVAKTRLDYGEDCLRLNIWTPSCKSLDRKGWPVIVWLHGGWFQIGDPCHEASMNPVEFVSEVKAIFVAVGYRLNVFGFLASSALLDESGGSSAGNYGLWDQRLAMDWVYDNIAAFGGDPSNIVLAGRSAGAYSVQAQTLYDFRGGQAQSKGRFQRLIMYSNAIPTQPKKVADCEEQFAELCNVFSVPHDADNAEKLRLLRDIPADDLVGAIMKLRNHTFRPVTDGDFILDGIFDYYKSGAFAAEFKRRNLRILLSEMANEESLYGATNSPQPTLESLQAQLSNYYAPDITARLLELYSLPTSDDKKEWQAVFGRIVADGQVLAPSRFLVKNLMDHGVHIKDIWRYLIAYRMSFISDKVAPMSFGATHAMDKPLWNYSIFLGPTNEERKLMLALIHELAAFVHNEAYDFGTRSPDEYKTVNPDGKIKITKDNRWGELLPLAAAFSKCS